MSPVIHPEFAGLVTWLCLLGAPGSGQAGKLEFGVNSESVSIPMMGSKCDKMKLR